MNVRRSCRILYLPLIAVLLFATAASAAKQALVFARIKLTSGFLYVYFKGEEMRIATSVKALKDADPIMSTRTGKSSESRYIYFPETVLPIPEKDLPSGVTQVTATFTLREATLMISGTMAFSLKDKDGVEWAYKWNVSRKASKVPSGAKYITLPGLKKLSLSVVTQANSKKKKVGVGLRLRGGNTEMARVYKDGKEVKVHVDIVNGKGVKVASEDGSVSKYGFG